MKAPIVQNAARADLPVDHQGDERAEGSWAEPFQRARHSARLDVVDWSAVVVASRMILDLGSATGHAHIRDLKPGDVRVMSLTELVVPAPLLGNIPVVDVELTFTAGQDWALCIRGTAHPVDRELSRGPARSAEAISHLHLTIRRLYYVPWARSEVNGASAGEGAVFAQALPSFAEIAAEPRHEGSAAPLASSISELMPS